MFEIPTLTEFALLALEGAIVGDVNLPTRLSPYVTAVADVPSLDLGPVTAAIGSLGRERLSRSTLVFVASCRIGDTADVRMMIRTLMAGLALQGVPNYSRATFITGHRLGDDAPQINHVSDEPKYFPLLWRTAVVPVSAEALVEAQRIGERLLATLSEYSRGRFRLFTRGFRAWNAGMMEEHVEARLHQFVRSLEGVMRPYRWEDFARMGQLFTGRSTKSADVLRRLYQLRSTAEHLRELAPELEGHTEAERDIEAVYRCLQAERLSSFVLRRFVLDPASDVHRETEAALEKFWTLSETEREEIWGAEVVDLARI